MNIITIKFGTELKPTQNSCKSQLYKIIENTMKQDAQTNQIKPKQTHTKKKKSNQIKPTAFVDLDLVERELERLNRKIRVERNKLEVAERERGERIACELWLWRAQREIVRESERFPNSTACEGISNPWI